MFKGFINKTNFKKHALNYQLSFKYKKFNVQSNGLGDIPRTFSIRF